MVYGKDVDSFADALLQNKWGKWATAVTGKIGPMWLR
jgi:DNA-binding ferritin-like protein (Dps family)